MSAANGNLSDVLRDFKKYTSGRILQAIRNNPGESRREWMLSIFSEHGRSNQRNDTYQFWQQDNRPMELYSAEFIFQKVNYIHNNPVEAGIVTNPWEYLYSSAMDFEKGTNCGLLKLVII